MMRLLEAILEANGNAPAGCEAVRLPEGMAESAPTVVALTCVDPRLNALIPGRLGLITNKFVWLRSAGNIVTEPDGNMVRSLALGCAVKDAREILIIGHTDCAVCNTTVLKLTESFAGLGVSREDLPANLVEFFGLFASERQNVLRAVEMVRRSPLIGQDVPVHGLLIDVETGRLERLVNGYESFARSRTKAVTTPAPWPNRADASRQSGAPVGEISRSPERPAAPQPATPGSSAETAKTDSVEGESTAEVTWTLPKMKLGRLELPPISLSHVELPKIKIGDADLDPNEWLRQERKPASAAGDVHSPSSDAVEPTADQSLASGDESGREPSPAALFDQTRRYKVIGSDDRVYGPINGMKILQWISEGRIGWDTPSQLEGSDEWRPLAMWAGIIRRILERKRSP